MADKDYYNMLGVSQGATSDEIKKAYRTLAKKHHPDSNQGNPEAEERFKEIGAAYEVLSNHGKRRQYDRMREWAAGGFPGGGDGPGMGPGGTGEFDFSGSGFDFSKGGSGTHFGRGFPPGEGTGGFGDFDELFSMFFDRSPRMRRRSGCPAGGGGLHSDLTLPFDLAATGGTITVKVQHDARCDACKGSGAAGGKYTTCGECGGTGMVSHAQGAFSVSRPCPYCYGRGIVFSEPCPRCRGKGHAPEIRTVLVTIPPGTEDGQILRLKGQGSSAMPGGIASDLLIGIHIQPHPFFYRRGLDLYCEVPVRANQVKAGTRIKVRTLGKEKVLLKVPPGTRNGTSFRIPGRGVETNTRSGDMFVKISVSG